MRVFRVLLVDDSAAFLKASVSLFAGWPSIVVIGCELSGAAAIQQVPMLRPDLVLVDLQMPDMDGLKTTMHIKGGTEAPFVFIMTLYDEPGFREAAVAAGADALISKAELRTNLLTLIEQVCVDAHQLAAEGRSTK